MRMLARAGWALVFGLLAGAAPAASAEVSAEELMDRVRRSMPDVPLELEASLRVLDPSGKPLRTVTAGVLLTPREEGRTARYTLFDAFGSVQEEMTVELGGGSAGFRFAQGDPPVAAELPDLFAGIQGTGISWMELSFSFFWWPNPRLVGAERVANRWDCQIVEIDCPPEHVGGWSQVRLWVAPAYSAVVRGEAWRDGRAIKRFDVQSVKKLRQVYMIGDLEVKDLVTGGRTRLKVGRMAMRSPDYSPEELGEFNAPVEW